ncbi:DegT/DnrJ/EryC1/StrS family aminotransferase [Ruegeria arenilitoris]|uniref:DegT/DnrJ/EryC1/StrS family aminotransferase n=1 Tax=Ruegeria arenilitoris TaxID=1173585 RepID=UPI001C94116F|nr:DegT/DnrJ/EryC1/StrS family aminotransferase [Ruegeria arenilitoris]MBY6081849.1 DegT/DnrJ/EryC1/StrS family aminotransferase [Ruegeria arenilitoris]
MSSAEKIRAVWPELPEPAVWADHLAQSHARNWHTNYGPVNAQFEERLLADYGRSDECVVTACNATSALSACLISEGIRGPVLCPAFTFQATAGAILGANCTPLIVDVDPVTGAVPAHVMQAALTETGARAAMLISPYGIATDFTEHACVCADMGVLLIIDNAAGLGIDRSDPRMGASGPHVREVYSLHATKPFGIGEGGAIFAPAEAETRLRSAMNFGQLTHTRDGAEARPLWGINGKMSEVAAAVGLAVADSMRQRVMARQSMARRWRNALDQVSVPHFCTEPARSPWQCFPILLQSEASVLELESAADARGIELRRYYAPSLGDCGGMPRYGDCAVAHDLCRRAIVLPVRSFMPEDAQDALIADVIGCLPNE